MASVTIRKLNKNYENGFHAVKDVSLEIRDKEFMVLVGPSGCGKTTTLRMVAGLEEITSGEIRIGRDVVNELPPMDRNIAMVFQNYALYPHKSVYQNMAFGLQMRKYPKDEIEKRVREAADILGIGPLLDRKPRQLSGGQRQRVAVGRAIVRHPEVFLFDEPLSNLDAQLRVQMRVELKRLHERLETTAIYVTHDQVEAMTLGDRRGPARIQLRYRGGRGRAARQRDPHQLPRRRRAHGDARGALGARQGAPEHPRRAGSGAGAFLRRKERRSDIIRALRGKTSGRGRQSMAGRLAGKTAFITAAGQGIGRGAALAFA